MLLKCAQIGEAFEVLWRAAIGFVYRRRWYIGALTMFFGAPAYLF